MEEESKSPRATFCSVVDSNLFTTHFAGVYLTFDECVRVFPRLNRQY
jgi:hypothetical protein